MSGLLERIPRRRRASPASDSSSANGVTAVASVVAPAPELGSRAPDAEAAGPPADAASAGPNQDTAIPSPASPDQQPGPESPDHSRHQTTARERGQVRRRVRYLRRLREVQLRDIGGFVLELHRLGHERPDLVAAKLTAAADTASELQMLELTLAEGRSVHELREAGIGGACIACGAVHGSSDRFCASCGLPLSSGESADRDQPPPALP